jgi:hypothetical protein
MAWFIARVSRTLGRISFYIKDTLFLKLNIFNRQKRLKKENVSCGASSFCFRSGSGKAKLCSFLFPFLLKVRLIRTVKLTFLSRQHPRILYVKIILLILLGMIIQYSTVILDNEKITIFRKVVLFMQNGRSDKIITGIFVHVWEIPVYIIAREVLLSNFDLKLNKNSCKLLPADDTYANKNSKVFYFRPQSSDTLRNTHLYLTNISMSWPKIPLQIIMLIWLSEDCFESDKNNKKI